MPSRSLPNPPSELPVLKSSGEYNNVSTYENAVAVRRENDESSSTGMISAFFVYVACKIVYYSLNVFKQVVVH